MAQRFPASRIWLLILVVYAVVGLGLTRITSLGITDAPAIWTVHDAEDAPQGLRNTINYVLESAGTALTRAGERQQFPLYYLLLDGWVLIFGESPLSLRLPSLLWGILGLIVIALLLTNRRSRSWGLSFAVLLPGLYLLTLGVSPLMQWLTLSLLTSWLLLRWRAVSGWLWAALYTLAALLMVLTHSYGIAVLLLQAAYLMYRERQFTAALIAPFSLPLIACIAWFAVFGLGFRLEPTAIFLLIGISVMLVLLNQPPLNSQRVILAVGAVLITQIITLLVAPPLVDYQQTTADFLAERDPLEPLVFDIPADSIMAYYKRQLGLRSGYTLDIGWRDHSAEEIEALLGRIESATHIWLILPEYREQSQQTIQQMSAQRQPFIDYRAGDYRFMRFDTALPTNN